MNTLKVELGSRSYPILIGDGLLARAELFREHVPARDVLVVSNTTVAPLYLDTLLAGLRPRRIVEAILPDGESHKTLTSVSRILDVLVANRSGRDCTVIALGGGVVDMAGFAAACYQRGVSYVQIPTTLLSQVDSSVGGKTGVNHPGGKNLIGAFHQPVVVLADTSTLTSLPLRELRAGLAEVIKYGLICDPVFFAWLETHMDELLAARPPRRLPTLFAGRAKLRQKSSGVMSVSWETVRSSTSAIPLGHAIESATHYTQWLHGEAIGAGLLMAATMSRECGFMTSAEVERVRGLIELAGLPTHIETVQPAVALEHMRIDKKVQAGRMRLVLMRKIGDAFMTPDYAEAALDRTLQEHFGPARG